MIGLRSLRNRLAVVFGLIVLGAIGTIYLTVTPRLEERLQDQKLERLTEDAQRNVEGRSGFAERFVENTETPLALDAVAARRPVSATETTSAGRQALVAYPLIRPDEDSGDDEVVGVAV